MFSSKSVSYLFVTVVLIAACQVSFIAKAAIPAGARWETKPNSSPFHLGATHGDQGFVVVGSAGLVRTSTDGLEWTDVPVFTTRTLKDVVWSGTRLIVAGDFGTVYTRDTGATQWIPRSFGTTFTINCLAAHNDGLRVAAAASSQVRISSNSGKSWILRNSPPASQIQTIAWSGERLLVGDSSGGIYSTDDLGETWQTRLSPDFNGEIRRIGITGSGCIAVGTGGRIFSAPLSGEVWSPVTSGTSADLTSLLILPGRVLAGSSGNLLLQSVDNGSTWSEVDHGLGFTSFSILAGSDATVVGGGFSYLNRSVDSGSN